MLLTGADGQLGRALVPRLAERGHVEATTLHGVKGTRKLDLSDLDSLRAVLDEVRPDLIFNAAAYTAVDRAETEPDLARAINAAAPGVMAKWAADHGAGLVHFSTDYVFDGRKGAPYLEDDPTAPLNEYGASKLEGEQAVAASGCRHVILRTSWVYASQGENFVLKMLELARERDSLNVVSDQVGRPTWAGNLARYALAAVDAGVLEDTDPGARMLHAADAGAQSWFEFARLVFETAVSLSLLESSPQLREVGSDAFPTVARRPPFSVLGTGRLRQRVGIDPLPVRDSLRECLQELVTPHPSAP
ncbi:MAG: dTDP-4-dehydrorhamnose reductase [Xanthomonadales bacterium]|jgi:dTDP-4-dehydrorhamnose reductase|nr:dTDP-4-dehydrorhamnose reductase [Xanthomonadales bacterium]